MRVAVIAQRSYHCTPAQNAYAADRITPALAWFQDHADVSIVRTELAPAGGFAAVEAAATLGMTIEVGQAYRKAYTSKKWSTADVARYHALDTRYRTTFIGGTSPQLENFVKLRAWLIEGADQVLIVWNGRRSGGSWEAIKDVLTDGPTDGMIVHTGLQRIITFASAAELARIADQVAQAA